MERRVKEALKDTQKKVMAGLYVLRDSETGPAVRAITIETAEAVDDIPRLERTRVKLDHSLFNLQGECDRLLQKVEGLRDEALQAAHAVVVGPIRMREEAINSFRQRDLYALVDMDPADETLAIARGVCIILRYVETWEEFQFRVCNGPLGEFWHMLDDFQTTKLNDKIVRRARAATRGLDGTQRFKGSFVANALMRYVKAVCDYHDASKDLSNDVADKLSRASEHLHLATEEIAAARYERRFLCQQACILTHGL